MQKRRTTWVLAILLSSVVGVRAAEQTIEPHALYEAKCQSCHNEHGADLARQKLAVVKDVLQVSRTGVAVDKLLRKHHGIKLSDAETAALSGLFKSGIRWAGVFQHRCASCHDKGVTFARSQLSFVDGRIKGSKSNADVESYLSTGHGAATPSEVQTLLEMFKYQLATMPK